MVYKGVVEKCGIYVNGFDYSYQDYVNNKETLDALGEWEKAKDTFKQKIYFKFENDSLKIPKQLFFGKNITNKELIKFLAIIEYYTPTILYTYYQLNEKYGVSDSTIVTQEKKIVKTFFIEHRKKKTPLLLYIREMEQEIKESKPDDFIYIPNVNYLVELYLDSRIEYIKESYQEEDRRYFNDAYYNDRLDLNQQSEDFWNSL
jgi:hypothetical protein